MIEQLVRFDIADYLKTPKDIAAYLEACVESDPGDGSLIQNALTTSFKQTLYERSGHDPEFVQALLDEAHARGFWKVLSRIFTFNAASLALCRSCGFREVGVYERHACLEGQWLDCVIVEHLIPVNQPH